MKQLKHSAIEPKSEYYVYVYFDPRKNPIEPIYVGKGKGDRYLHHLNKKVTNFHFANKLAKIKLAELTPEIKIVKNNITNNEACELEKFLIKEYGRADQRTGTLCNWTDGGDGTEGYKHSERTKKLFSQQRSGKKQTPKQYAANCARKISDNTRKLISNATKGHKWHTSQQIDSIKKHNSNRTITNEMRAKWSKTRLGNTPTKIQYPPIDQLIEMIKNSSKNKISKELGVSYSSLSNYLRRRNVHVRDARFKKI